jgi:hypothetical protein
MANTVLGPEMFENDVFRGWEESKESYSPDYIKEFEDWIESLRKVRNKAAKENAARDRAAKAKT